MNELAQHMVDTVKEWQCKIGVRKEKMDLFYPLESLKELLQLEPAASTEELEKTLTEFQKENESLFGKLHFWKEKKRYGIEIPEDGVIHIAKTIPDPEFLKSFLKYFYWMCFSYLLLYRFRKLNYLLPHSQDIFSAQKQTLRSYLTSEEFLCFHQSPEP